MRTFCSHKSASKNLPSQPRRACPDVRGWRCKGPCASDRHPVVRVIRLKVFCYRMAPRMGCLALVAECATEQSAYALDTRAVFLWGPNRSNTAIASRQRASTSAFLHDSIEECCTRMSAAQVQSPFASGRPFTQRKYPSARRSPAIVHVQRCLHVGHPAPLIRFPTR